MRTGSARGSGRARDTGLRHAVGDALNPRLRPVILPTQVRGEIPRRRSSRLVGGGGHRVGAGRRSRGKRDTGSTG